MMTCLLLYTLQMISADDNFFPFLFILMSVVCVLVTQLCLTLCNPTDYSLPGFTVHGILQARRLEWIVIPFSRGTSQPRDQTLVSCIGRWILYHQRYLRSSIYVYTYICVCGCIYVLSIMVYYWRLNIVPSSTQ